MVFRRAAEQLFDRTDCCDQSILVPKRKLLQHRRGILLRAPLQWCESLSAVRRQRQMALPGVAGGDVSLNQSALFEITQSPAEIAGIEIERATDVACGRRIAARDLVKHPRLAERVGAVEVSLAQHAELPRVEAVEAADSSD